ncbi:hypothetical protein Tco_0410491 [Tanacetum coccineum]
MITSQSKQKFFKVIDDIHSQDHDIPSLLILASLLYGLEVKSKDNEDPSWSTSFKTRRTSKTSSALEALWKTLFMLYLYKIGTLCDKNIMKVKGFMWCMQKAMARSRRFGTLVETSTSMDGHAGLVLGRLGLALGTDELAQRHQIS